MATILIGLDDTDNATSRGTGYVARRLAEECARRGLAPRGVTRHQFLKDPRIPYTSNNSGACVAVRGDGAAAFAFDFVAGASARGSDPGVCVAEAGAVPREVVAFGREAARRVLRRDAAAALARAVGLDLRPLGGTGLGIIGALAAVGQRAEGNDGRFIGLPGLRELEGRVTLSEVARLGIRVAGPADGRRPRAGDPFETLAWVRPRLLGGAAVLPVQWSDEHDAWVAVDRKRTKPVGGPGDG